MNLYIGDCECDGLIEQATKFHCLCFSPIDSNKFYIFCDMEELSNHNTDQFKTENVDPIFFPTNDYIKLLNSPNTIGICVHNIYGYDLKIWKKLSDIKYDWKSINGRNLDIIDSLVQSQYLYPDRPIPKGCKGAHSLQAWGVRLGLTKYQVEDWSDQPLNVYINRVIEDVRINKAVYFALQKEIADVALPKRSKVLAKLGLLSTDNFSTRLTIVCRSASNSGDVWGKNSTLSGMNTGDYPQLKANNGADFYSITMGPGDVWELLLVYYDSTYVAYELNKRT